MLWIFVLLSASLIAGERAILLNNKAALHLQRGEYAKAEELFKAALQEHETKLDESGDVAAVLSNLGEVYRLTGRFDEAEATYTKALQLREKEFGPDHATTANTLNAFACLYLDLGQSQAAEQTASRAVAIREHAGQTSDSQFAAMLHNLGEAKRRLKKLEAAESLFERSLKIRQKIGGSESSDYASSLHHIGAVRQDQGRLDESFELYRQALSIRSKLFGPSDLSLGPTYNNMSLICMKRGDLACAKSYADQAVGLWKGTPSVSLALALMNLAEIHIAMQDTESAEPIYRESVGIWEKAAPKHPQFTECLLGLTRVYIIQGKYAAAEKTIRRAPTFSEDEAAQIALANVLRLQGRMTEAAKILPVSTEIAKESQRP